VIAKLIDGDYKVDLKPGGICLGLGLGGGGGLVAWEAQVFSPFQKIPVCLIYYYFFVLTSRAYD